MSTGRNSAIPRKTIKLTGDLLEAAKKAYAHSIQVQNEAERMMKQQELEIKAFNTKHNTKQRQLWLEATKGLLGSDDPMEALRSGKWYLDFDYFEDHGDIFLCKAKKPPADPRLKPEADDDDDEPSDVVNGDDETDL